MLFIRVVLDSFLIVLEVVILVSHYGLIRVFHCPYFTDINSYSGLKSITIGANFINLELLIEYLLPIIIKLHLRVYA